MINFVFELLGEVFRKIDYAINHMTQLQWAIVSIVAVTVGFLALRGQKV